MVAYKLYYFNMRGLAELIRYLLKYGGIDFEDIRIERENWPKIKDTMPVKQMPVLEVDGEQLVQSVAICRYLSVKFGLAGKNEWENLQIDSVVDTFNDLRIKVTTAFMAPDDKKEEMMKKVKDEHAPFYFGKLNELAEKNDGHLALKRLTWADIYVSALGPFIEFFVKDSNATYPALKKVRENVESIENIKKWIAERPVTDY